MGFDDVAVVFCRMVESIWWMDLCPGVEEMVPGSTGGDL